MTTAAKVGAFFLLALALTGILIWNIEDLKLGRKLGKTVSIQFDDVSGLKEKADVRVAGVLVGRVARIRLVGGRAVVDVELEKDVDLHQGAAADIATLGMLGENYIELIPGPPNTPRLPEGTLLRGREGVSLDSVSRLARDIEVDLRDVTGNLTKSLGGAHGQERIEAVVDNMVKLSKALRDLVEANRAGIDATTNNFREFSANMTTLVERIDRLVVANQGNVTDTLSNAKELSAKLQATVDNMNAITGKINSGQGSVGQLVTNDETTKNLNDALVAVKEGVNSVTGALSEVKKLNFDLGIREEYLTGPGKGKGYLTLDVQPVGKPRFYRFELASQPLGFRQDQTDIVKTTFPDGHTEITRTDTTTYKSNRPAISAEVGYRLGNWVGRAGVIESTGGAGIDYLTLRDRLRFSAEMFDFGRDNYNPHGKLTARYYFSPSVFITGGWDDFLNTKSNSDSIFVGAGVRWGDDAIKYLAGTAASAAH
jgi:phospholipid/cholesterol/gamma-HCH transport system substrate-binding protein